MNDLPIRNARVVNERESIHADGLVHGGYRERNATDGCGGASARQGSDAHQRFRTDR